MAGLYPRYVVFARDVYRRTIGEIDYTELRLEPRFNDIGGWYLIASAASNAATLLSEAGGIIVKRNDGNGLRTIFSGPVRSYKLDDATLTVGGESDEVVLAEKVATPDPAHTGTVDDPFATEQDLREGTASTVMLDYVRANAIYGQAAGTRGIPGLALGIDPGLGTYIYGIAKFVSLLALLQDLALAGGGLRFQVLQSDTAPATIELTISEPPDMTDAVILRRGRGTLANWERTVTRPGVSRVYVLGQGQGLDQVVIQANDPALSTKYGHEIEAIVARLDTADVLALQQEAATTLADSGEGEVVAFTPVDTPSFRWGQDYDLGYMVSVIGSDGRRTSLVIRGVNLTLTAPGGGGQATSVVQAIVSTPGDTTDDPASRQQRAVGRRVSRLETSFSDLSSVVSSQWNVGNIRITLTLVAAPGWLLCDGSAVSRVTYHALFGVIGTTYGAGDGSTTFNLPDFRGRVLVGVGGGFALGDTGGAATVDLAHDHTGPPHSHSHNHTGAPHTHSHDHTGAPHTHSHAHTSAGHSHSHAHTGAPHTHSHSHAGAAHTHSHNHTGAPHTHSHSHGHSHGFTTGGSSGSATRQDGANAVASTTHTHTGTTESDSTSDSSSASFSAGTGSDATAASAGNTGGDATAASFSGNTGTDATSTTPGNTGSDASAASFSGATGTSATAAGFSAGTGSDATAASFSGATGSALTNMSLLQPYGVATVEIYAQV